jgi:hypothetical protein
MTVFVYVNTGKQVGDTDHIKVFANVDAVEKWFEEESKPDPAPAIGLQDCGTRSGLNALWKGRVRGASQTDSPQASPRRSVGAG